MILSRAPEQGGDEEDQARHSNVKLLVSWDIWASAGLECTTSVELGTWFYNREQRQFDLLAVPLTEREYRLMKWEEARAVRFDVAKEAAEAACLRAQRRVKWRERLRNGATAATVDVRQRTHHIAQRKKVKEVTIAATTVARQRQKHRRVLRRQQFRMAAAEAARAARLWIDRRTQQHKQRRNMAAGASAAARQ